MVDLRFVQGRHGHGHDWWQVIRVFSSKTFVSALVNKLRTCDSCCAHRIDVRHASYFTYSRCPSFRYLEWNLLMASYPIPPPTNATTFDDHPPHTHNFVRSVQVERNGTSWPLHNHRTLLRLGLCFFLARLARQPCRREQEEANAGADSARVVRPCGAEEPRVAVVPGRDERNSR